MRDRTKFVPGELSLTNEECIKELNALYELLKIRLDSNLKILEFNPDNENVLYAAKHYDRRMIALRLAIDNIKTN